MAALTREEITRLARLGAERRLLELRQEETAIRKAFPDLEDNSAAGRRRGRALKAQGADRTAAAKPPRRRKMSAAARKAVSDRMKKYWATRRKAKG